MASEATAGDQAEEEYQEARLEAGVDIPTTSAMYKQLQRLAIRFYSRSEESAEGKKYEWRGQQDEDERIDDEIDMLRKHRDVAGRYAHREFGRDKWRQIKSKGKVHEVFVPKFEYFNLVGDDELEAATDRLVNDYVKYHKKQGKGFEPRRLAEWESERRKAVKRYRGKVKELREAEKERLESFEKPDYDDLHLTNAFKGIPLYQIFQQQGATGGGPYRFARDVSRYYTDEEHMYKPDPVGAAYIKKHAGNAGLTSSEMSRIIVESGHKSAIQRAGDYAFMGREVHGLEKGMFGDKYKQKDFAGHFMGELKRNTHLQNVLMKISMERERQSGRPEADTTPEAPAPTPPERTAVAPSRRKRKAPSSDEELYLRPPRKKGKPADVAVVPGGMSSAEKLDQYETTYSRIQNITSLATIRDRFHMGSEDDDDIRTWRYHFPEISSRIEGLGGQAIKDMSKRAEALKHKHYSNGPELSGVAGWSNNRRFIHPGDIWAAQDKTWYHDDPVARPPREGSQREALASENRMLLQNPMYQFMHDRISQIGHAFTAAEMSALRDKLDPDTSATIMQAMRLHAKGSRTQASMDPTVSVALSNSSIPEELRHMKQVLRRRGSDAVRKERNATINITVQAEMLQREAAEMEEYYKEIEEAYVDHGRNLDRTSGGNYLAVLREKYGTLLQQVRELDGGRGLSAHLLTPWKTLPEVGKLLPLKWEEQPHPTRKTPIKVFTPGAGQKRNMLAGGWTQDRFLKMMYQIPEMELYLETKGYTDFSKYEWGPYDHDPSIGQPSVRSPSLYDISGESEKGSSSSTTDYFAATPSGSEKSSEFLYSADFRTSAERSPSKSAQALAEDFDDLTETKSKIEEDLARLKERAASRSKSGSEPLVDLTEAIDETTEQVATITEQIAEVQREQSALVEPETEEDSLPGISPAFREVLAQYKTVGSADVSQMEMASDTVESGRRGGSRGSDTLHERASLSRSDISRGILSSTSSSTSEGTVAMRARAKARERSGRLKQKAQRLRRDAYNVGFSGKPASDLVGSTPDQMRAFRKGRGRYRASKKVVGGLETIEEKQEEAPPAPIRAARRLKRRRRRGASAITGSHAHRVLGPARAARGLSMPNIGQPLMRALPIIAPVVANEVRYAVVARREQTIAPSAMGKQALFRGYLRDVGSNVAPYGRAHLVSIGNVASRSHFMQELTEDSNMGRRKVEAESRHGPFRDARGNYMTKARSANVRYQVRNRAIHITVNRGVHMGELDVLIGKLAAHRMSVNHSRITLIVSGKKMRLGKLDHTDLAGLRETVQRALTRNTSIGIMIHDEKPNGALHKNHMPDRKYMQS